MWTASATPETERTRYSSARHGDRETGAYLGGTWEHGFGSVQTSSGSFLNFLDLGSSFTDPGDQRVVSKA
jgi:hypothetical protein